MASEAKPAWPIQRSLEDCVLNQRDARAMDHTIVMLASKRAASENA